MKHWPVPVQVAAIICGTLIVLGWLAAIIIEESMRC